MIPLTCSLASCFTSHRRSACRSRRPTNRMVVPVCPSFARHLLECMARGHAHCCRWLWPWPYPLLWLRCCGCVHTRGIFRRISESAVVCVPAAVRIPTAVVIRPCGWPWPVAGRDLWLAMSCGRACGLASPLTSALHLRSYLALQRIFAGVGRLADTRQGKCAGRSKSFCRRSI
jgi:hypothetical protein